MSEKEAVEQIEAIIHNRPLSAALVRSITTGLKQPFVHLSGETAWAVFQYALDSAIRNIEAHPRGKLFRRLLAYGPPNPDDPKLLVSDGETVLSDPECGQCVNFIFSFMVNRFKGDLAELLAIAPCLRLVKRLQKEGQLANNIELYFGETIAERWQARQPGKKPWGGFVKGSDGLIIEKTKPPTTTGSQGITIHGLVEIKSMPVPETKLLTQLKRHRARLQGGVKLAGVEWTPAQVACPQPIFITVLPSTWKVSRRAQWEETEEGWQLVFPDATEPPTATKIECKQPGYWQITLDWSKEALEQAAYEMTFWYMSQVGKVIYAEKALPKEWEGMSPEEAGYNSIKMMLYYVMLRWISPRQGQKAIKLYNAYSFGYPLAMDAKEMLWPEDIETPKITANPKIGYNPC
jgi:hypothetical protein